MRSPAADDFTVTVEKMGDFIFGRRTMRDELKIAAEYRRMVDGLDDPGSYLDLVAGWMSTLVVLLVKAPDGKFQNLEALDPLDPDTYSDMKLLYDALREKEGSFRRKPSASSA